MSIVSWHVQRCCCVSSSIWHLGQKGSVIILLEQSRRLTARWLVTVLIRNLNSEIEEASSRFDLFLRLVVSFLVAVTLRVSCGHRV